MKQNFCFILFFLLLCANGYAQTLDSIEQNVVNMPPGKEKMDAYNKLAWRNKIESPEKAHYFVEEALKIALDYKDSIGQANSRHTKGMIYWYQSDYEKASKHFFDALAIRETIQDTLGLSRSYNNIGNLFFRQGNYQNAFNYYSKALDYRIILGDSTGLLYSYSNIGDIYEQRGEIYKARENYAIAATIAEGIKHNGGLAFALNNYGSTFLKTQELDSAAYYFNRALGAAQSVNDKTRTAQALNKLASLNIARKQFILARNNANDSKQITKELNSKELLAEASQLLSLSYAGTGDYKAAFREMELYNKISSELTNIEREKYILEIQSKYEAAQKESEIFKSRNDLLEDKAQSDRLNQNFLISLIAIGVIATLVVLYMYREQVRTARLLATQKSKIQQQNKELIRSNASLEQFAYVASHDLKEPLRNISTFTSLLSRKMDKDTPDDDVVEYMSIINSGVNHMGGLLEDILDYSKLSKHKDVEVEEVDLNEVIDSIKKALVTTLEEKNATIVIDDLPTIKTNRFRMFQLFQNFISNGIKFNDSEQKQVKVGYAKLAPNQHQFVVEDNGIGIPEEYVHKVFQIFQRLDKNKYEGTGIGLAICKKIIDQHEGSIAIEQVPTGGTRFVFTLEDRQ